MADQGENARSACPGQTRCHAVVGQLDQGVRHRILMHDGRLELAKCLDCLGYACYPKGNEVASQSAVVAIFAWPVRSALAKTQLPLHLGGAATTGAASAGLPDTSAVEVAIIAEVHSISERGCLAFELDGGGSGSLCAVRCLTFAVS